jgi:hypothetical protein
MRYLSFILFSFLFTVTNLQAQSDERAPEFGLTLEELEAHLRFIASDALMGRRTGEPGNDIAAAYLAAQFAAYGLETPPGQDHYFQKVPFDATTPPQMASLSLNKSLYEQGEDLLLMTGNLPATKTDAVFANYGWADADSGHDDYKDLDVKGKIVIVLPGTPEGQDPNTVFQAMGRKRKLAKEQGAVALIELFRLQFPWSFFKSYFNKETLSLADDEEPDSSDNFIYGWLKEKQESTIKDMQEGKRTKAELMSKGFKQSRIYSNNVMGIIEGSDPALKNEYVLLSAHFDHVGTGKSGGGPFTAEDSIFNGARDNAMGTTALLGAVQALSERPPRRSVIALAVTGEEIGLLGSRYYVDNPLVPLDQTVFNINADGAGYNDVSYIAAFGYGRTGTDQLIDAAANIFGLDVLPNPIPEQGIFDRSDNASFAQAGVPALSLSPGTTAFDETVSKYYHQVTDNPDTIDFEYLHKYARTFARTARLIADKDIRPMWIEGDKYEEAGKELYNR